LFDRNNPDVFAIRPDQSDFGNPDIVINSKFNSADNLLLYETNPACGWFLAGE